MTWAKKAAQSPRSGPWWANDRPIESLRNSPLQMPGWIAVLILIGVTLALNLTAIDWGLPQWSPWNSDSIAGGKTVRMLPRLYKSWTGERYPRAQFLITGTLYKPFIRHWQRDPLRGRDSRTGKIIETWKTIERVSTLILVSRLVTVLMAVGAVLGVFATTRLLCRDTLAALLAAMVLMFSAEFTYFAHLGNLDVPVTFWFIWTAYWVVRAMQSGKMRYFVLTGLFAGMVVCTKDPSIGHVGGLAVFLVGAALWHRYKNRRSWLDIIKVIIEGRLWVALACFALVFLLMNNVLTDYEAFSGRMQHWLGVKKDYKGSPGQQWRLVKSALRCIRYDCGVWMFWGIIASLAYCLWKHRLMVLWALAPFVLFHLAITTGALQVQARYHIPSLTSLVVLAGIAGSALLRVERITVFIRAVPLVLLFGMEAMFAISVDFEMATDSRYRAEAWIRENLDKKKDTITFISPPVSMPRSRNEGYRVRYTHKVRGTTEKSLQHKPKLIALSNSWYLDRIHFDQRFRAKLLKGKLGYKKIAEFGPRFRPPNAGIFTIATWATHKRRTVSPKIVFMERVD